MADMEQTPDFAALLRLQGFKATPGRVGLLRALWLAKRPLTVDEVGKKLDLNIVTLYRALESLADQGLLLRGSGTGDVAHFSYPRGMHHHHLICMDCGFIKSCVNCN
jgi:Fe2+ or Zn2+ uptake regulation protein